MKLAKKLSFLFVLLTFVTVNVFAQDDDEVTRLPDLTLNTTAKGKINVADYGNNDKISIFAFWATWCAPCKKELSNLADLYEDWKEDYNVEIIAVSTDDAKTSDRVKAYVDSRDWEYDVLLDVNQELQRALNFQTVPFTAVIDHEGDIVYEHSGYSEGDEDELEEILKEIRAEEKEAEKEEKK